MYSEKFSNSTEGLETVYLHSGNSLVETGKILLTGISTVYEFVLVLRVNIPRDPLKRTKAFHANVILIQT